MQPAREIHALLPESQFAQAKAQLSNLMTQVVQRHLPLVVDRNRGRERAVLIDARDLALVLERYAFEPQVTVSGGEFVVRLPELNLVAAGSEPEAALAELVELAEDYAETYLERVDFYLQTDRRAHLPWVLRIALTEPELRPELIAGDHSTASPAVPTGA